MMHLYVSALRWLVKITNNGWAAEERFKDEHPQCRNEKYRTYFSLVHSNYFIMQ